MRSGLSGCSLACVLLLAGTALAQTSAEKTTSCTFEDGKSVSVRYPELNKTPSPSYGSVWTPNNQPLILMTETPIQFGGKSIPVGAYGIYFKPDKDQWSMIVNKNIDPKKAYDSSGNLAKNALETGQLSTPVSGLSVAFAHLAPKQCNLRVYMGKSGMWAELKEQ